MSALIMVDVMKKCVPFTVWYRTLLLDAIHNLRLEKISIPDKCSSNFLINFNKIKTSLGKSATQTLGRLSDILCLVSILMITQPFSFPVKYPEQKKKKRLGFVARLK